MARFTCVSCGNIMWNGEDDNTFEHFLIKQNIYNLEEKEFDKIVEESNRRTDEWNKDCEAGKDGLTAEYIEPYETWFDVCSELGNDVWICPECETMHIFERESNRLSKVYKLVDPLEWNTENDETRFGISRLSNKYIKIAQKLDEKCETSDYQKIKNELKKYVGAGEIKIVRHFCREMMERHSDNKDLVCMLSNFLSEQERKDTEYLLGTAKILSEYAIDEGDKTERCV